MADQTGTSTTVQEPEREPDGPDIAGWVIRPAQETRSLEKLRPPDEAMEALRAAGYEGDVWVRVRNLTATQLDEAGVALFAVFEGTFRGKPKEMRLFDLPAFRDAVLQEAVVEAELPSRDGQGKLRTWKWADYDENRRKKQVLQMGDDLFEWFWDTIAEACGARRWLKTRGADEDGEGETETKTEAEELAQTGN